MTTSNAARQSITVFPPWRMPILPDNYPDRSPRLSDEERTLMERYATAPYGSMTGGRARNILHTLERFDKPFQDTVKLAPHTDTTVAAGRRHLFKYMAQTGAAFWAWSKETWVELIQAAPVGASKASGTRFWMINLAYLFCDFLYVGASTPYGLMAETIFGQTIVDTEVDKLRAPLVAVGYARDDKEQSKFRWLCSLCMLANRHPSVEAFSALTISTVNDLLPDISGTGQMKGRQVLMRLQTSLCYLGILDEPVVLGTAQEQATSVPALWQNDPTIDSMWIAWVRAFYDQTPHHNERTIRYICYQLLLAGRWLKKSHPDISDPTQWDESLAAEYVAYTCNDALCGDLMLPSSAKYRWFQNISQQLSPGGINSRLRAMRSFFSHLQRRPYTVDGKHYPRLQVTWLPHEAFRTPDDVKAACQPNPKDIQEDTWFKLIWAACTLTKEKLGTARNAQYPLAYYRAACLIWVTAARRSDEIRRLHVGCVRREWAPEMRDEQGQQIEPEAELAYLRVPINKMKGDFYVPIPLYVADAIEVWESMRPPNQKALIDRKTRKPTHYLFQYRHELMGTKFLNDHAIPLLCKLAGVSQTDVVGRITSHRARATTATWMHKMGMAPADIGKLLGHTDPLRSLPWYLREDKHHLGRAYRKANPLERYVAAILDTNAHARQEPCVFYYLSDGPDGRPRMCGNPHFSRCIHQLMCIECEAFIDHEQAEAIEKREGAIVISVPIPLPPQMVAELNEQDEARSDATTGLETLPPPTLPGPAFHFNKKVPMRPPTTEAEEIRVRLQRVEAQLAKKQGKTGQRSASMQALLRERAELQARLEAQEKVL